MYQDSFSSLLRTLNGKKRWRRLRLKRRRDRMTLLGKGRIIPSMGRRKEAAVVDYSYVLSLDYF